MEAQRPMRMDLKVVRNLIPSCPFSSNRMVRNDSRIHQRVDRRHPENQSETCLTSATKNHLQFIPHALGDLLV